MPSLTLSNELQFLREFLARPFRVASPIPSGRVLARKIAQQIAPQPGGLVVELGPGTGAVTRAILASGIADSDLIAIESERRFVALLRAQIPAVRTIEGDAFRFLELLGAESRSLRSIVSGLPVLGQPLERRKKLLGDAMAALRPGNPFIQFSYSASPPLPASNDIQVGRAATVWRNLPPMQIWVYRRPRSV